MFDNIFFWTGEEKFLLEEQKKFWKESFQKKYNDQINCLDLDVSDNNFLEIESAFMQEPFLAPKKLVFLKNFPFSVKQKKDDKINDFILNNLEKISENILLIFIQTEPDKRTKVYKELIKKSQVKEFKKLTNNELSLWVKNRFKKYQLTILPSSVSYFLNLVGNNLYKIDKEIQKLDLFIEKESRNVSELDIKEIVTGEISVNVFNFLDAFNSKNFDKMLNSLFLILKKSESLMQVLALLNKQCNYLITIKKLNLKSSTDIIKICKVHPFVAKKLLSSVNNFSLKELEFLYKNLLDLDLSLKTGKIKITANDERELLLSLETLIFNFKKNGQNQV